MTNAAEPLPTDGDGDDGQGVLALFIHLLNGKLEQRGPHFQKTVRTLIVATLEEMADLEGTG